MKTNQVLPVEELMRFILGKWISKPIYIAAELGIADILDSGPKTITEIAQAIGAKAPRLYRIMRALASVGIFSEQPGKVFGLTPMAELLKAEAMRDIAILFHAPWSDKAWELLLDGVTSGITPFEKAHGMELQQWLDEHPEISRVFNRANAVKAATSHRAIIDAYDFSKIQTLVDLGGGTGALMIEVLKSNPAMRGVVADLPAVVHEAEKHIQMHGLEERCDTAVCDFFEKIPLGGDAYLLSNILHDWPDSKCQKLLDVCHRHMKPGTPVLIVEMIVPPGNGVSMAKLLDIEMLVMTGGKERSQEEYETLLKGSGFRFIGLRPTKEDICIIEGIRL